MRPIRRSDKLIRSLAIELASYKLSLKDNKPYEAVLMLQRMAEDVEKLVTFNELEVGYAEFKKTKRAA